MSNLEHHVREATRLLNAAYATDETACTAMVHALLAVKDQLGELTEQQRRANLILACNSGALTAAARARLHEVVSSWCIEQFAAENAAKGPR